MQKILIANRGEIAVRIIRACRELGLATVAVHSTADDHAMHVKLADESVCIGGPSPRESYLNIPAVLAAAEVTAADGIHPGYGFLAENAKFAEIAEKLGFVFVGPTPAHIRLMGDKITALATARELGLPTIPGSNGPIEGVDAAVVIAKQIGLPVIVKAAAGGGGRGMKVAREERDLRSAIELAMSEAQAAFGDSRVYLEKYLQTPRHVEVQVLCDTHGNVSILGERDCSLQRRHQKILEETPSPAVTDAQRTKLFATVAAACRKLGYRGAGTFEFLFERGEFYFIEMNTRLQVEHPVTEMVTGVDIVAEQLRVAAGETLRYPHETITPRGHSIECRINAEDPVTFAPSPGTITDYYAPGGPGVRVDSALFTGAKVPPYYDATIAKLIVHGATRAECITRLDRALREFVVGGIKTNLPLHRRLVAEAWFKRGDYTIHTLEQYLKAATA
jgi:acetyl-CoA carboxylase biotin carboxylase subunit